LHAGFLLYMPGFNSRTFILNKVMQCQTVFWISQFHIPNYHLLLRYGSQSNITASVINWCFTYKWALSLTQSKEAVILNKWCLQILSILLFFVTATSFQWWHPHHPREWVLSEWKNDYFCWFYICLQGTSYGLFQFL
jgi:hypothetical protein